MELVQIGEENFPIIYRKYKGVGYKFIRQTYSWDFRFYNITGNGLSEENSSFRQQKGSRGRYDELIFWLIRQCQNQKLRILKNKPVLSDCVKIMFKDGSQLGHIELCWLKSWGGLPNQEGSALPSMNKDAIK